MNRRLEPDNDWWCDFLQGLEDAADLEAMAADEDVPCADNGHPEACETCEYREACGDWSLHIEYDAADDYEPPEGWFLNYTGEATQSIIDAFPYNCELHGNYCMN